MGQQPRRVSFLLLPTMLQGVRTSRLKPVEKLRLLDAEPLDHIIQWAHRVTRHKGHPRLNLHGEDAVVVSRPLPAPGQHRRVGQRQGLGEPTHARPAAPHPQ